MNYQVMSRNCVLVYAGKLSEKIILLQSLAPKKPNNKKKTTRKNLQFYEGFLKLLIMIWFFGLKISSHENCAQGFIVSNVVLGQTSVKFRNSQIYQKNC